MRDYPKYTSSKFLHVYYKNNKFLMVKFCWPALNRSKIINSIYKTNGHWGKQHNGKDTMLFKKNANLNTTA
jgi:hypothetical protein